VTVEQFWRLRVVGHEEIIRSCCPPTHPIIEADVGRAEVYRVRPDGVVHTHVRYAPRVIEEHRTNEVAR
jgi:hypothetical protein